MVKQNTLLIEYFKKGVHNMFDTMISTEAMSQLEERLNNLLNQGVNAETKQSGELNMSGCASSSCMGWA